LALSPAEFAASFKASEVLVSSSEITGIDNASVNRRPKLTGRTTMTNVDRSQLSTKGA